MAVNKRIQWIDIARGIAILLVIIGHSLGNYWPGYLGNFIFVVHMPIFFYFKWLPLSFKRRNDII